MRLTTVEADGSGNVSLTARSLARTLARQEEILNELEGHFSRNEKVWERWAERGVSESTQLPMDFHFYATGKTASEQIVSALKEAGFTVTANETRTLFVFRGWDITATETRTWTLAQLQERTKELFDLAAKYGVSLEGLGAEMP